MVVLMMTRYTVQATSVLSMAMKEMMRFTQSYTMLAAASVEAAETTSYTSMVVAAISLVMLEMTTWWLLAAEVIFMEAEERMFLKHQRGITSIMEDLEMT